MTPLDQLARAFFSVATLKESGDDKAYWQTRSPLERLQALEVMRQCMFGYDPATSRVQRVLEITTLEKD